MIAVFMNSLLFFGLASVLLHTEPLYFKQILETLIKNTKLIGLIGGVFESEDNRRL